MFTPLETLSLTLNGMYRNDDYLGGQFGLRDATTWSAGFDVNWTPAERVAVFGGYVYENIFQKQRSRNRDVNTTTGAVSDFPDWNWISDSLDRVHTVNLGAKVTIIPQRLDWTVQASYSYALGEVDTRNETQPLAHLPDFPNPAAAIARHQPPFEDTFMRLDAALRYWITKQLSVSLIYAFESFEQHDWRTDNLNPFIPGVSSIWLGGDLRNYTAHIIGATVGYRFK
jgi:Putative outer membrane beta-barrel porin, MtrB/PioB